MKLVVAGIALAVVVMVALVLLLSGGGEGDDDTVAASGQGSAQPTVAAAAPDVAPSATATAAAAATPSPSPSPAPSATPSPTPPPAPASLTDDQLRAANVNASDVASMYGTCAHEFTATEAADVQQAVSSSPPLMQAMAAGGYEGYRSSSRATAPCAPFSVSSVAGNASGDEAGGLLFDTAVTIYGEIYPGAAPFDVPPGAFDSIHCQTGVYPPNNITGTTCWARLGSFVAGVFILLPPNPPPPVIEESQNDARAFWERVGAAIQ